MTSLSVFRTLIPLSTFAVVFSILVPAVALEIPKPTGGSDRFSCDRSAASNATLILVDATDGLTEGQVAFIKDNFIKDLEWTEEDQAITFVALHDDPLQMMYSKSFCAPKPVSQINSVTDSASQIKSRNKQFRRHLNSGFDQLVTEFADRKDAKRTLLLEAIAEVYRNARYNFKHARNKNLVIVSDLYQSSPILSFFKICSSQRTLASRPLTCPNFSQTVEKNSRFANYITKAAPKMGDPDAVTVYYLNVDGRVDRSAEKWWAEYFTHAGLPAGKLKIIPELQN
jgi:hypothetical protein